MKKLTLLILSMTAFTVFAQSKPIKWYGFNDGMKLSIKDKKFLIVDFYTQWCKWCKVMEEKSYADPKVRAVLDKYFILAKIDADEVEESLTYQGKSYSLGEFLAALNVSGFPTTAFFDSKGEIITVVPGYLPPETFLSILEYIRQSCYEQKLSFQKFLKKKASQCQ